MGSRNERWTCQHLATAYQGSILITFKNLRRKSVSIKSEDLTAGLDNSETRPAHKHGDVVLRDGSTVRVRGMVPTDDLALLRLFKSLRKNHCGCGSSH